MDQMNISITDHLAEFVRARVKSGTYPDLGRKWEEILRGGFRLVAGNYLIYYLKKDTHLEIVGAIHGARDQMAALDVQGTR